MSGGLPAPTTQANVYPSEQYGQESHPQEGQPVFSCEIQQQHYRDDDRENPPIIIHKGGDRLPGSRIDPVILMVSHIFSPFPYL
jgi:hypothetical protein